MLDFFNYMITYFGVPLFFIGLVLMLFLAWQIEKLWDSDGAYSQPTTGKITDDEIKKAIHRAATKRRLKFTKENEKRANAS